MKPFLLSSYLRDGGRTSYENRSQNTPKSADSPSTRIMLQFPAVQIDAGQGNIVMTDSNNYAYFLIGSQWYKMGSLTLKHVSVGPAGIWGVDLNNRVYKYVAGSFVFANGETLQQVDAGGDSQVVGVTDTSTIHCLKSTIVSAYRKQSTLSWITLPGLLMYVSCSTKYGCWGVNSAENIYFTKITPSTCGISGWIQVDGLAVMVEIGTDGSVFVVTRGGEVFQRREYGTKCRQMEMEVDVNRKRAFI
uniref:Fish-egg lectin-like n=1 Tax=Oreochromis niloticus TaxID=8128 RepID=I3K252_ORENI